MLVVGGEMELERLRMSLLVALGVAAVGCRAPLDDSASADDSATEVDDTGTVDTGATCDAPAFTEEVAAGDDWDGPHRVCTSVPDAGCASLDEVREWELLNAVAPPPDPEFCGWGGEATCGPEQVGDACCYVIEVDLWCEGRPLEVAGASRRASPRRGDAWSDEVEVDVSEVAVDEAARERLVEAWTRSALDEHASVASFARFALELAALGAPPELLARTARAMADEVEHARLCFGIARALGGGVSAGPLDVSGAQPRTDPAEVLRAVFREGCIGETVAAARAGAAGRGAVAGVREALARIAEDEAEHATLAWRTVRWLLSEHPDLREVLAAELAALRLPALPAADPQAAVLRRFGRLPADEAAALARRTIARVIRPCAEALLDT